MAAGTSVKLVIPSEIRLIDLVHAASEKVAELAGFDADDALNVGLAVREAVINAMLHGNKRDPGLKVSVTLTWDEKGLRARVHALPLSRPLRLAQPAVQQRHAGAEAAGKQTRHGRR